MAHLPSAVTAAPPTQLAPYLPGTPSGATVMRSSVEVVGAAVQQQLVWTCLDLSVTMCNF